MNTATLLNRFRVLVRDLSVPYLWSDDECIEYMDAAQKEFARKTLCFPDMRSEMTALGVSQGDEWLDYDKRIIKIRSAHLASDKSTVSVVNAEEVAQDYSALSDAPGKPRALVVGMDASALRLIPQAIESDTIQLSVYRLPLADITATGQELEIPEKYHADLIYWMAHLAYQKQDAETFDRIRADQFAQVFNDRCLTADAELRMRNRRTRAVRYNGGV